MELSVHHVTSFEYGGTVRDSVNEVRLCPRTDASQSTLDFQLLTDPPAEVRSLWTPLAMSSTPLTSRTRMTI